MAHQIKDLLAAFDALYTQHHGMRYPFNGGRDSKLMKELLAIYSEADIQRFMAGYFEMDDPFIEQGGHSLQVFRACLPKVIRHVQGTAKVAKTDRERAIDHNADLLADLTGRGQLRRVR